MSYFDPLRIHAINCFQIFSPKSMNEEWPAHITFKSYFEEEEEKNTIKNLAKSILREGNNISIIIFVKGFRCYGR
jgi:hypothetical protein